MFNKLISFSLNEFCETFTFSNYAKLAKYVDKLTNKIIVFSLFLHMSSIWDKILHSAISFQMFIKNYCKIFHFI